MGEINIKSKDLKQKTIESIDNLHKKNKNGISPIMVINTVIKIEEHNRCKDEQEKERLKTEINDSPLIKLILEAIENRYIEPLKGGE